MDSNPPQKFRKQVKTVFREMDCRIDIDEPDRPFVIGGVYYRGTIAVEFTPRAPEQGH